MPASPKKAATLVSETERELADTNTRIEQERQKREAALLADDGHALDQIELTMSRLSRAAGRAQERLRLLKAQAQADAAVEVAKRREAMIERVAKKLEQTYALANELQANVIESVKLFRRIVAIREDCQSVFALGDPHINAAIGNHEGLAMTAGALRALLAFEFYRVSADPFMGGVPGERRQLSLPGSVSPTINQQLQPEKITPFASAIKAANTFGIDLLRGKQLAIVVEPQAELPVPSEPGSQSTPMPSGVAANNTQSDSRLGALLKKQLELAADPSREAEYMRAVQEISELTAGA